MMLSFDMPSYMLCHLDSLMEIVSVGQGEVFIRGRRRHGLISDQEISGLRIGLVKYF